jgi:FMN-dependent NADH-azoreductase
MKLLHIDSSLLGNQSVTRELSAAVVRAWRTAQPDLEVSYLDLAANPPPQLTGEALRVIKFNQSAEGSLVKTELAQMEALLVEFLAADAIVIGVPMYNFSVPTQLKAWIDALSQPGRTFAYTDKGPRGLAVGKRVVIASSRGNRYSEPPMNAKDFQETYIKAALGFMGVTDIDVIRAEGVNRGLADREAALLQAHKDIATLFAAQDAAA